MACIYKITNIINGKSYIGQTTRSLKRRWKEHIRGNRNSPIHKAIQKYGEEKFLIETIEDNISIENLDEREIYYISYFDTYNNGYNVTTGGTRGVRIFISLEEKINIINFYLYNKNIRETGRRLGYDQAIITGVLDEYNIPRETHKEVTQRVNGKAVQQIDINTNEIIQTYPSTAYAAKTLGKPGARASIGKAASGIRKTSLGYKWKFV